MAANAVAPFIQKLRSIVDSGEAVRWRPDGTTFIVYDVARFEADVLAKWFKSAHMASFVRQLNFYGFRKLTSRGRGRDGSSSKQWEFQHPFFLREDRAAAKQIHRRTTADTEAIRSEGESMRLAVASLRNQLAATKKQLAEAQRQLAAADAARQAAERETAALRSRLRSQVTARGSGWVADSALDTEEAATESDELILRTELRGVVDRKRRRVATAGTVAPAPSPSEPAFFAPFFAGTSGAASTHSARQPLGIRRPQEDTPAQLPEAASFTIASTPKPAGAGASSSGLETTFAGLRIASPPRAAPEPLGTPGGMSLDGDCDSPSYASARPVLERMPSAGSASALRDSHSLSDSLGGPASAFDVAALGLDDAGGTPLPQFDVASSGAAAPAAAASTPSWADAQQHHQLSSVTPLSRVGSDRSVLSLASSVGSAGFAPTLGMSSRTDPPASSSSAMPGAHELSRGQPMLTVRSTSIDSTGTESLGRDLLGVSAFGSGFPSLPSSMAPPPPRPARHGAAPARIVGSDSNSGAGTGSFGPRSSSSEVASAARQVASMAPSEFAKTLSQIALAIVCSGQVATASSARKPAPAPAMATRASASSGSSAPAAEAVASPTSPVPPEEAKGAALDILRRLPEPAQAAAAPAMAPPAADAAEDSAAVVVAARRVLASSEASPAPAPATSSSLPPALAHIPAELLMAALMRIERVQTFVAATASSLVSAAAMSAVARAAVRPQQRSLRA